MGKTWSVGTDTLWGSLRLPRMADGKPDEAALRRGLKRHWPVLIALLGVGWLTANGMAIEQVHLAVALLSVVPLWITSRAWRLPLWLQFCAATLPLSVAAVALIHLDATGSARVAKYAYAVVLLLGVIAWATTARRRLGLALAVVALVLYGFALSWLPWWLDGSDPWRLMRGTLEWHNQFAAHMLTGLAVGLVLAIVGRGRWTILAFAGAVCCGAGVLLSGSRYGGALALGVVAAALAAAIYVGLDRRSWAPLVRWGVGVGGALLLPLLLRSPLFFPEGTAASNPLGTILQRGGLESSGSIRMKWAIASWEMGLDHPLAGVGLLQFDHWVTCYGVRPQWHPHNEWAYAFAEGGVIGLLPLVLIVAGLVVLIVRMLRPWPSAQSIVSDPAPWAAVAALAVAIADLVVEYDLFYPVLLAMLALSAGIAAAPLVTAPKHLGRVRQSWVIALFVVVLVAAAVGLFLDPVANEYPWLEPYITDCLKQRFGKAEGILRLVA